MAPFLHGVLFLGATILNQARSYAILARFTGITCNPSQPRQQHLGRECWGHPTICLYLPCGSLWSHTLQFGDHCFWGENSYLPMYISRRKKPHISTKKHIPLWEVYNIIGKQEIGYNFSYYTKMCIIFSCYTKISTPIIGKNKLALH